MATGKVIFLILLAAHCYADNKRTQDNVYFKFTNARCVSLNESYSRVEQCRLKAVHRYESQLFVNISLLRRPVTNCKINIDMYRKYSLRYQPFPFNITLDACQFLKDTHKNPIMHNVFLMLANKSSFTHPCPYDEPHVIVRNLSIPYTPFFNFVPTGSYMIKTKWIMDNIVRAVITVWYDINNPRNTFLS